MLPKQATRKDIFLFAVTVLVIGGLISLAAVQTVDAAISVGQTGTKTNTCGLIIVPVLCTNNQDNEVTVTPTPVATQDIDVTGTQNIDQVNTCDDNNSGDCLNEASLFFGNEFFLGHDQAADILVESFEQDIQQENDCLFFGRCENRVGNGFVIVAEDDDGILATGTDVDVGLSVQDVGQLNDCDSSFTPDPLCSNAGFNPLDIRALQDGDIDIDDSSRSVQQENVCDSALCNNYVNQPLRILSAGSEAKVNLDTNTQQALQSNDCATASCGNEALNNNAELTALDESEINISDNTQTIQQNNECGNIGFFRTCSNRAVENSVRVVAEDTSTINLDTNNQQAAQSNDCAVGFIDCENFYLGLADLDASEGAEVDGGDNTQTAEQGNVCDRVLCGNGAVASYGLIAHGTSTIEGSNLQQKFQSNACTDSHCTNSGVTHNGVLAQDDASVESDASQKDVQNNKDTLRSPSISNTVESSNAINAAQE